MTDKQTQYRCVVLTYPGIPPFYILEHKKQSWNWLWSTQDHEFFRRVLRREKIKLTETVEQCES